MGEGKSGGWESGTHGHLEAKTDSNSGRRETNFDVPVQDPVVVEIGQTHEELPHEVLDMEFCDVLIRMNQSLKIRRDEIEDDVEFVESFLRRPRCREKVPQTDQIRMRVLREHPQDPDFTQDPSCRDGIAKDPRNTLDSDLGHNKSGRTCNGNHRNSKSRVEEEREANPFVQPRRSEGRNASQQRSGGVEINGEIGEKQQEQGRKGNRTCCRQLLLLQPSMQTRMHGCEAEVSNHCREEAGEEEQNEELTSFSVWVSRH